MYRIGSDDCATINIDILSALEDLLSSHVGSVADEGVGKKREVGCNKPYPATC